MKNNNLDVDSLLREAMNRPAKPGAELIQKVKQQTFKEEPVIMKKHTKKFTLIFAAVIAAVCLTATTAFAAWNLFKPGEIAEMFGGSQLSAAFESESAVNINESVTSGDYIFTLLASVNGVDISDRPYYVNGEISDDRLYAVVAIQNADGTPMTIDAFNNFTATPLVKGLEPWKYNIVTLHGGKSGTIADGVLYFIIECDDITTFADKGLYIGVCTDMFISNGVFNFDEATGEISVNPDYSGASAVFNLPVDKSLADPVKAEQYLKDNNVASVTYGYTAIGENEGTAGYGTEGVVTGTFDETLTDSPSEPVVEEASAVFVQAE
ncbi:hypothetical protein FACS1894105_03370 [Clostridia bacterium]|nr:hypothetical protein FACS1894105_03370 [Clostridia bacterium]